MNCLCGNKDYLVYYNLDKFKIVKCKKCNLMRTLRTNRSQLDNKLYSSQDYNLWYLSQKEKFSKRFKKFLDQYQNKRGKVLDIGCSYGFFLEEAKAKGWDTYGIEIASVTAKESKKRGLNILNCNLKKAKFQKNFFDLITLWDVLEHLKNPLKVLRECKRILKKDGVLFIQSPNMNSFMSKFQREYWEWLMPNEHLWHFSPKTLRKILKEAGFKDIKILTWECPYNLWTKKPIFKNPGILKQTILTLLTLRAMNFLNYIIQKISILVNKGALVRAYAKK